MMSLSSKKDGINHKPLKYYEKTQKLLKKVLTLMTKKGIIYLPSWEKMATISLVCILYFVNKKKVKNILKKCWHSC